MRRLLLLLTVALLLHVPSGLFAFDWGGSIDTSAGLSFADGDADESFSVRTALFASNRFSPFFRVEGQVSYTYSLERDYLVDVDYLFGSLRQPFVSEGRRPLLLDVQAGRFRFADMSGRVLSTRADGITIGLETPQADVLIGAAYTGLVLRPNSTVKMSESDVADEADDDLFAPPRLVVMTMVTFNELVGRQSAMVSTIFQNDLRSDSELDELNGVGRVNTGYVGLGLTGPITSTLFYNTFYYYGFGRALAEVFPGVYEYRPISGHLAGYGVQYFMPQRSFSVIETNLLFASGDANQQQFLEGGVGDGSTMFLPISSSPFGLIFSPRASNLLVADVGYSVRPFAAQPSALSNLQTQLKYFAFFRPTTGVISEPGVNPDGNYLGSEVDFSINFRPFSDLGLGLALGAFFPSAGEDKALNADAWKTEFLARFDLSFRY